MHSRDQFCIIPQFGVTNSKILILELIERRVNCFYGNIFTRKICCLFYGQLQEFLTLQRTIKRSVNPSYFLMGVNRQESCKNFPTPIFPPVKIARHTCDCWNRHKNALFTQLLCVLLQLHHLSMKLIFEKSMNHDFLR